MESKQWNLKILSGIWYISEPVICYYAGYCASYFLINALFHGNRTAFGGAELNGVYMTGGLLFLAVFLLPGEWRNRKSQETKTKKKNLPWFNWLLAVVLAVFAALLGNELITLLKPVIASDHSKEALESLFSVTFLTGVITYGIIAPVTEEVLFRFLIADRIRMMLQHRKRMEVRNRKKEQDSLLYRKTGFSNEIWQAAFVSALLFGIYHGNLEQGIYAFLMGILLAIVYNLFHHISAAVMFHMTANLTAYLLAGDVVLYHWITQPIALFIMAVVSVWILSVFFRQNCLPEEKQKKTTT
jgi:membrane protease YdiL (CAAX protease family)